MMVLPGFPSFMAGGGSIRNVTYMGSILSEATSVSIPSHQIGDLIFICAIGGSSITPSLGSTYTSLLTGSFGANARYRIGYKFAVTASETSRTWSNTVYMTSCVYRGASAIGNTNAISASGTQRVTWVGLTAAQGPSLILYFGRGGQNRPIFSDTAGPLFIQRAKHLALTQSQIVIQETNEYVNSIASQLDVSTSTGSVWATAAIELVP